MKLTTLAKLLSCNINITRKYYYKDDELTDYHVEFSPFIEFLTEKGGAILHCIYGVGDTEEDALKSFVEEISNYKFAIRDAYTSHRKEMKLPDEKIEIDL